ISLGSTSVKMGAPSERTATISVRKSPIWVERLRRSRLRICRLGLALGHATPDAVVVAWAANAHPPSPHHSRVPNTWINPPVDEVDQQVHAEVGERDNQNAALNDGIIATLDRIDDQTSDAGQVEDRLSDDAPSQ